MSPEELRSELTALASKHADGVNADYNLRESAVIFDDMVHNFLKPSYEAMKATPDWWERTRKTHSQVKGVLEMQSSNSSDALLMNIFCYPKIFEWKGVRQLLGVAGQQPQFGIRPGVAKEPAEYAGKETEIDLVLDDVFVEAKLTEADFCHKETAEVEKYSNFADVFHTAELDRSDGCYLHYQIIRNLLAAAEHDKRHLLLCDARRPDLVRSYFRVVARLKDIQHRTRCGVIFWQEIAAVAGKELKDFLRTKYGC